MIKKRYIPNLIYLFILLLPIIDVITALFERYKIGLINPGIIIKLVYVFLLVYYIIFLSKSKYRKKSLIYICLLTIYILLFIVTKKDIYTIKNLFVEGKSILKYFFYTISFTGLINIFEDYKIDKNKLFTSLLLTSIFYTILLIVPYITKTDFNTYNEALLSGSIGWFYSANEVSTIVLLLIPFSFLLINNDKKYKWLYIIIFFILYSLGNIGTKVSFLGAILIILLLFIFNIIKNKKIRIISNYIYISLITFMVLLSFIGPMRANIVKKTNNEVDIMCYNKTEEIDYKIGDLKYYKYINIALSGRELKLEKTYNLYKKSNVYDKLFGIGFSNRQSLKKNYNTYSIEMDIMDLFFHYGLIGTVINIIPLLYVLFKYIKLKKNIESTKYSLILLLILGISSIAGHVTSAPAVSMYISIYLLIILTDINEIKYINNKEYNIVENMKKLVNWVKKMFKKYREIIAYLIVGGLTTVVSFVSYLLCVKTFLSATNPTELQIANIISWICAVLFAYITNKVFVFKTKDKSLKEFFSFISSRVLTLLMDMAIMFICVTLIHMNDVIAKLIVQVVVTIANYIFSKIFVFKK